MPSIELPLASDVDFPIKEKLISDVYIERNPDGSIYKGNIGAGNGPSTYRFNKDFYNILKERIYNNSWFVKSIEDSDILSSNIDLMIRSIVANKEVHNYLSLLQDNRTLSPGELYELFGNVSEYLCDVKRYNEGIRICDMFEMNDVERFKDKLAYTAYNACVFYLDSINLDTSDIITSDYIDSIEVSRVSDIIVDIIDEREETLL